MQFKTHNGNIVDATEAFDKVADDWTRLAGDVYNETETTPQSIRRLYNMLLDVERIRNGEVTSFTIWQRVNEEITGECVPFMGVVK